MLTVHHLSNSHSHVVLWLMEELGAPYEIVPHQRDPLTRRSPESLRAVHPAAKAPTIVEHGIAMVESTGVLLYLLESYGNGRLRPAANTAEAMQFYQWLTYIEGSAKGPVMSLFRVLAASPEDPFRAMMEQAAAVPLELIEAALDGRETIVPGQFTVADIQLGFFESILEGLGQIEAWPNMRAHLERMRGREAYQRAEAKGGPVGLKGLFSARAGEAAAAR